MIEQENISLLELQEMIGDSLRGSFSDTLWLRAEISELKQNPSGHCYLTLVENDPDSGRLAAKASAIIWASTYRSLKPYFRLSTGSDLAVGMNVLVKVQVQYSQLYGLSLIIYDIDPSFTAGALELEKQRTIARLKEEGLFDLNSMLPLPRLPRSFAVITSDTAAGWRDFRNHLLGNDFDYKFKLELFAAVMQGSEAPTSVVKALDRVAERMDEFDAVLIMRGGGGAMDLACFDDYEMASNIAQFPLPVLTGIGHDHDYHVADMVAHTYVKTPTALADNIIDIFSSEDYLISSLSQRLQLSLKGKFSKEMAALERWPLRMKAAFDRRLAQEMRRLDRLESGVAAADPGAILSKGYVLALKDGRKISCGADLASGDELSLLFSDGARAVKVK